jgi:hypothetical protein
VSTVFAPRVAIEPGCVYIIGATGLWLWHLPVAEARLMTDEELRAEIRQAARMNGVRRRDLSTAYKAANVSEQAA